MLASDVMDLSASFLNDAVKSIFTYTVQLPYLNVAMEELQEEFELNNMPITNQNETIINIPAGTEGFGDIGQPALPSGLIMPLTLYERTSGSQFSFIQMKRMEFLPVNQVNNAFLIYWAWLGQKIKFIPGGATGSLDIQVQYTQYIYSGPVLPTDLVSVSGMEKMFLAYRTAALCAEFIGENVTRAQDLNNNAGLSLNRLLTIGIKAKQAITTRRKPFMSSWRARRII